MQKKIFTIFDETHRPPNQLTDQTITYKSLRATTHDPSLSVVILATNKVSRQCRLLADDVGTQHMPRHCRRQNNKITSKCRPPQHCRPTTDIVAKMTTDNDGSCVMVIRDLKIII